VGEDGRIDPIDPHDPDAITSMVFREGRAVIVSRRPSSEDRHTPGIDDSFLSVPIRYSPGSGQSRKPHRSPRRQSFQHRQPEAADSDRVPGRRGDRESPLGA
jgi:hypothetical protein